MADIRINSLPSTATSFNTDDYIAIDGTSGGTRKMLAATLPLTDVTFGSSGPSAKSSIAARAARQGLVFDGTAGNFGSATIPAAGAAKSIHLIIGVPSSAPAANQAILVIGNDSTFVSTQWVSLRTTGALWFETTNSGGSDAARIELSNFVSSYAGKNVSVVFTLDGSSTATAYVNGVSAATNSDADWATDVTGTQLKLGGSSQFAEFSGSIESPLVYNRALSAAEVVALYEAGVPAGSDYNSASNTSVLTGANSDFSSAGNWVVSGGTTISGGKLNLSDLAVAYNSLAKLTKGLRYKLTITIDSITAGSVQYYDGVNWNTIATTAGTYTVEFTCAGTYAAGLHLRTNGGNAVLDTALYYQLGLLLAPDAGQAGGGLTWYDTSGNAANITLPASGVTWNVPTSSKTATGWTFGGNLTVSGTLNLTQNQQTKFGSQPAFVGDGTTFYLYSGGTGGYVFRNANDTSTLASLSNAGNLTVSGTGTSTIGGDLTVTGTGGGVSSIGRVGLNGIGPAGVLSITSDAKTAADAIGLTFLGKDSANNAQTYAAIRALIEDPTSTSEDGALQLFTVSAGTVAEKARLTSTGRLLLGTGGVDSGALLQVGTNTSTSAGGMVFGTDLSLYRGNTGFLILNDSAASDARIGLFNGGTQRALFEAYGVASAVYMGAASAGWATYITSGNQAIALTLDSSQNATFAKKLAINGAALTYDLNVRASTSNTGSTVFRFEQQNGTELFAMRDNGTAIFAGDIRIGNTVNTVSPTSPNRTITMVIGGTTYYIHAKTTND